MRHRPGALRVFALAAVAAGLATPVRAQFRAGPEFRANSYTTGPQFGPRVAVEREGEFVIAWSSDDGQDGDGGGVFAHVYRGDGSPRSPEFRVNTTTAYAQADPSVAHDGNEIVIVWSSFQQDGSDFGVFGRRFDKDGDPDGGEFQVNTYTTGPQMGTWVAKDPRGGFVVAWTDYAQDYGAIKARRYDATGAARGDEFRVNVYTTYRQSSARVATADDGRFVVAWNSYELGGGIESLVFARRFDAAGSPVGAAFQVNASTLQEQYLRGLAVTPDGRFVVVWNQEDGDTFGVYGRRFDAAGQAQGSAFRVHATTTGSQTEGSVAVNERGDFTVVWKDYGRDGGASAIVGQRFDKLGNRMGQEFVANSYTTGYQFVPEVSMDGVGNFTVTWASSGQDGSDWGVYGQRFGGIVFAALALDATPTPAQGRASLASDGNGVLEPGETVTVETSWENISGVAQGPLGGSVLAFTGPPGPSYTVPDASASFGVIPDQATVGCAVTQDCYVLGVSGARPATHWDGLMEEGVNPVIQGQVMPWDLHVGDSFTDVPRTNPFYRFIETLLHNGVTGGCGPSLFCPQASTSREQMAVFVLVAAEEATFSPVACGGTPMFNDVPVASPFCRWVEELARRGVVSGCGGGNYCPADAVSREQMAVFVLRTLDEDLDPPPCTTPMFADVPASSPFCRWIEELARRGVVAGCGGGNYCPTAPVTREQMGVFLAVTFGLQLYGP